MAFAGSDDDDDADGAGLGSEAGSEEEEAQWSSPAEGFSGFCAAPSRSQAEGKDPSFCSSGVPWMGLQSSMRGWTLLGLRGLGGADPPMWMPLDIRENSDAGRMPNSVDALGEGGTACERGAVRERWRAVEGERGSQRPTRRLGPCGSCNSVPPTLPSIIL